LSGPLEAYTREPEVDEDWSRVELKPPSEACKDSAYLEARANIGSAPTLPPDQRVFYNPYPKKTPGPWAQCGSGEPWATLVLPSGHWVGIGDHCYIGRYFG